MPKKIKSVDSNQTPQKVYNSKKVKTKMTTMQSNIVSNFSTAQNQQSLNRDETRLRSSLGEKAASVTIQKFLHKSGMIGFNKTFICCKESCIESPTSFYGCFYLGPFPESLSLTLSHNLRRTLLSEIPGLAITAVEIDGVLHKYSNIPGIKETVLDILSNLQNIHLTKCRLANSFVAFLKVRGPGVVKASDIRMPAGVALVNPDQYIATLAEDGFLNMKIWIHEGKNAIKQKPQNNSSDTEQEFATHFDSELNDTTQESWSEDLTQSSDFQKGSTNLEDNGIVTQDESKANITPSSELSLQSNKLYLDAVFMPVTKVNSFVETNFKATDDPAKAGPFVFQTTPLVPNPHKQQDSTIVSDVNLKNKTLQDNTTNSKTIRPNSFTFLDNNATHYLVLESNTPELDGEYPSDIFNVESSELSTLTNSGSSNYFGVAPQPICGDVYNRGSQIGIIAKQNLLRSDKLNPILMSPVTYNQPAKQCHIVLEIWTNGSIHPRQALKECLDFLAKTFIGLNNAKILGSMYKSHITYQKVMSERTPPTI